MSLPPFPPLSRPYLISSVYEHPGALSIVYAPSIAFHTLMLRTTPRGNQRSRPVCPRVTFEPLIHRLGPFELQSIRNISWHEATRQQQDCDPINKSIYC